MTQDEPANSPVVDALKHHGLQVQTMAAGRRAWDRLLTQDQRIALGGDFESAWLDGQTVGMWRRLHGGTVERAIVELAAALGFADATSTEWLLRELGESPLGRPEARPGAVPVWNELVGELKFRGVIIRRIRRPAQAGNIVAALNEFERQGWVRRIDDPLSGPGDDDRLRKTINTLNKNLAPNSIEFRADGAGRGIIWQEAELGRS